MKLIILNILFFCFVEFLPQSTNNNREVFLYAKEKPLKIILDELRIQTGMNFIYSDDIISDQVISVGIENIEPKDAVDKILYGLNISYKEFGKSSIVLFKEKNTNRKYFKTEISETKPEPGNAYRPKEYSFVKPEVVSKIEPPYPDEAVKNHIEGNVSVRLFVTKYGNVSKTTIDKSSGSPTLDSSTTEYLRNIKFTPATLNGRIIEVWVSMQFKYYFIDKKF